MFKTQLFAAIIVVTLAGASLLAAQSNPADPTPTPTAPPPEFEVLCDAPTIVARQAELVAQLDQFEQDAQTAPNVALDNLFKLGAAYQELALECGYIPADAATRFIGTDVDRALRGLETVRGDPINGQLLFNGDLACAGCHVIQGGEVAPHLEGTLTRIEEARLADPALADYTVERYLVESIVVPGAYVVPNYTNVMPTHFGSLLTLQDLADLVVYLESQDGPSPE